MSPVTATEIPGTAIVPVADSSDDCDPMLYLPLSVATKWS